MHTDYEPTWIKPKSDSVPVDIEQKLRLKLCSLHRVLVQELYQ